MKELMKALLKLSVILVFAFISLPFFIVFFSASCFGKRVIRVCCSPTIFPIGLAGRGN